MEKTILNSAYQPVQTSRMGTKFWDLDAALWEAERRYNLVFRYDLGVPVWTANRVRIYYDVATQMGFYDPPPPAIVMPPTASDSIPLKPIDLFVQTGAVGAATRNRTRPFGCLYTEDFVERMVTIGRRVLLVHDAPDTLVDHPQLHSVSAKGLRMQAKIVAGKQTYPLPTLDGKTIEYWDTVSDFIHTELGVRVMPADAIPDLIRNYRIQYLRDRALLQYLRPTALIMIAHYYRAPQIAAARSLNIHTVDYQHGLNSRHHLGYGYPNVVSEQRDIPDFPDSFWSWGSAWTNPLWFPNTAIREIDHPAVAANNVSTSVARNMASPYGTRPPKTMMLVTSWAMRSEMGVAISALAAANPDWTFRLKLHPREAIEDYDELISAHPNIEVLSGNVDVSAAACKVRYVLGICSSALFDVLLSDCRIAVLRLPGVEYVEEFIDQHNVPVVEPDGTGFEAAVLAMETQAIPLGTVFHRMSPIERTLMDESLSIPATAVHSALPDSSPPRRGLQRLVYRWALNAALDPRRMIVVICIASGSSAITEASHPTEGKLVTLPPSGWLKRVANPTLTARFLSCTLPLIGAQVAVANNSRFVGRKLAFSKSTSSRSLRGTPSNSIDSARDPAPNRCSPPVPSKSG